MNLRLRSIVIPAVLVAFTAALYLPRLQDTPTYPDGDEVYAAVTAHSVASTGRDPSGRFLLLNAVWFPPILAYCIAFTLKLLPFSEGAIRLPMALFGVIDVLLMYLIGKRLFRREPLAIGAAVLLALTPIHFSFSRMALQFQTPLPFILGWLLCLLIYLDRGRRAWLVAAGVMLGMGLFTYIAAYVLMPIYALLTCGVLYQRREPLNRYAALAAGFAVPALWCVLLLTQNAMSVRAVLEHYQHYERDASEMAGAVPPSTGLVIFRRLASAGRVYGSFWSPRLLFVSVQRSMSYRGVFLLPVAGLLVAALLRVVRRPAPDILLIIGALLSAPLPASLVDQPQQIHRAAAMLPFGVLLAIMGLEHVWTAESPRARRVAFAAVWGTLIGLALIYRADLPRGQAVLRAVTVPVAATGLGVLMRHFAIEWRKAGAIDWRQAGRVAVVALAVLIALRITYAVVDVWTLTQASVGLLTAIGLATLVTGPFDRLSRRPLLVVALLTAMSSVFMFVYVDHTLIPRLPLIRPGVMVLAVRFICPAAALAVLLMLAGSFTDDRGSRWSAALVILALVCAQLAYFDIDYFADLPARFIQATVVLAGVVGVALLHRRTEGGRLGFGPITAAAVITLAASQFASFHVNYIPHANRYSPERETSVAFEAAIQRARNRVVPTVYMGLLEPVSERRWMFYAIKHNRSDLLPGTAADAEFKPDRVRALPPGSIVILGRTPDNDRTINEMVTRGELKAGVLDGSDGPALFWMLERVD